MDFIPKVKLNIPAELEETDEITGEENPNFIYDDDDDNDEQFESYEEEVKSSVYIPETKIEAVIEDDIFDSKPKSKPKEKTTGKKQRKPMSDAHKEKLKLAREKAQIVRKAKAEERKQAKEMEKQEKELLKLKKKKELEKLRREVEDEPKPQVIKREEPKPQIREVIKEVIKEPTITKKDLEEAQLEAIIKYEALRKDRKAKKKEDQEKKAYEDAVRQKIMKAMRPNNQFNSRYSGF